MSPPTINSAEDVRRILATACTGREMVFLVTPYIRFETNFVHLEPEAVHVRITMGAEEAIYALRSSDLHMRFPTATQFMEGPTKTLGFGMVEGKRTIRLAIPKHLKDDELRAAFRVERVGRVEVSFSTARFELGSGTLNNVSVSGAKFSIPADPGNLGLEVGSDITLGITLQEDVRINTKATVRWLHGRTMGVSFAQLPEAQYVPLSRWVFQRREEELERVERGPSTEWRAASHPGRYGVVLVSSSKDLEGELQEGWGDLPTLSRAEPALQSVKEALAGAPSLLIFHIPTITLDSRRRLKMLVEIAGGRVPFMLLGSGMDQAHLFDLGNELKAAGVFGLLGKPTPFFFRLVHGILRRHAGSAES